MTDARTQTPDNPNFLSHNGFMLQVKRMPAVRYMLQELIIPGLVLPPTQHPNPFVSLPYPGDHIEYGTLRIEFKVDEDMQNYEELHNWVRGLGFPDDFQEYADLSAKPKATGEAIFSDLSVIVTTNLKNTNKEFTFRDAFPISIGELQLSTTATDVMYINCSAEFKYTLFDITTLP